MVGWAAAAQFVAYAAAAAVAARTSDRRPRAAVAAAGATAALGCLGVATTSSAAWFVVLVLLGGTGAGLASPALVRLVDAVVEPSRAATAQSLVNTGTAVGVVVAGLLALTTPSIAAAWWAMAAVNAGAALGLLALVGKVGPGAPAASETAYDLGTLASRRSPRGRGRRLRSWSGATDPWSPPGRAPSATAGSGCCGSRWDRRPARTAHRQAGRPPRAGRRVGGSVGAVVVALRRSSPRASGSVSPGRRTPRWPASALATCACPAC